MDTQDFKLLLDIKYLLVDIKMFLTIIFVVQVGFFILKI